MLTVSHLSFSYNQRPTVLGGIRGEGRAQKAPVLRDVSFALLPGQCMVVAGPNGCGKSTLLAVLSGALPCPAKQRVVRTDGERIGIVPQGNAIFEDLTVLENLRFFSRLQKKQKKREPVRAEGLTLPLGLTPYANVKAAKLSGGYKKRLAIACTQTALPDIWLYDEPCESLDLVWRDEMIRIIQEQKLSGCAIIYVGHDPAEFTPFYDSVLFLKNGCSRMLAREKIVPGTEEAVFRHLLTNP